MVLVLLGLLSTFAGIRLDIPILLHAGMGGIGLAFLLMGWDAMITRHIVIGSRRRGTRRTYTGIAAILQGVNFNIMGLVVIAVALFMFLNVRPESIGAQIARRPGFLLLALGIVFLVQAVIAFIGPEISDRSSFGFMLDVVFARVLPGVILVVLGIGALGLGLFEITAPNAFDEMGGSLLETLYGVR